MKYLIAKILMTLLLAAITAAAYGGAVYGWFLPRALDKPISLRDGSAGGRSGGHAFFFTGRSHYGGGYSGGK
ncbi:MAG: hypothetical protein V2B18_07165 [Pseudomonadota bacterium]